MVILCDLSGKYRIDVKNYLDFLNKGRCFKEHQCLLRKFIFISENTYHLPAKSPKAYIQRSVVP